MSDLIGDLNKLNGWQRLGVVFVAPIALIAGAVGYESNSRTYAETIAPIVTIGGNSKQDEGKALWDFVAQMPEMRNCDRSSIRVSPDKHIGGYYATCDLKLIHPIVGGLKWAGGVVLIAYLINLIIGWVYSGFRRS